MARSRTITVLPVLDLKGGLVVRGMGGERARYRPIESLLAPTPEPLAVACAFRERLGLERLYLADLDAIEGGGPSLGIIESLASRGFHLAVDAGSRTAGDAVALLGAGAGRVVAPLETLPDPASLEEIISAAGSGRVVFSLDMKNGVLLGQGRSWPPGAEAAAAEAVRRGARSMILLDLASVGSCKGPPHLPLLLRLASLFPDLEIWSGGGVRGPGDLDLLEDSGVRAALVASALHDGAITREDLEFRSPLS